MLVSVTVSLALVLITSTHLIQCENLFVDIQSMLMLLLIASATTTKKIIKMKLNMNIVEMFLDKTWGEYYGFMKSRQESYFFQFSI